MMVRAVLPPGPGRAEAAWNRICCSASSGSPQKEGALGRASGDLTGIDRKGGPAASSGPWRPAGSAGPSGQGCLPTVSRRPSPGPSSGPPLSLLLLPLDLWVRKGPSSPRHTPFRGAMPRHRCQTSNSKITGWKGGCTAPPIPTPPSFLEEERCHQRLPALRHSPPCPTLLTAIPGRCCTLQVQSPQPLKPQPSWGQDQGLPILKGPPENSGIKIHNISVQYFLKIKLLQKILNEHNPTGRDSGEGSAAGLCTCLAHRS